MATSYEDRGVRPYTLVVTRAGAGELMTSNGEKLPAFETNKNTVATYVRQLRKDRLGLASSDLAKDEPRDAVEKLRRRYLSLADSELRKVEAQTPGKRDLQRMEHVGKIIRQAASIPGPKDPRPRPQGSKAGGEPRTESQLEKGLAGQLLNDHRKGDNSPAQEATAPPTPREEERESGEHRDSTSGLGEHSSATQGEAILRIPIKAPDPTQKDSGPGVLVSEIARLASGDEQGQ